LKEKLRAGELEEQINTLITIQARFQCLILIHKTQVLGKLESKKRQKRFFHETILYLGWKLINLVGGSHLFRQIQISFFAYLKLSRNIPIKSKMMLRKFYPQVHCLM